ncbi:hypothetical protein Pan44_04970 [Caulifigura coniformis]|uniref:LTXXQ motif protein n=1 Tax=Caulifigura coniformis TaxID=2527983 RepID=A0A517S8N4_9PLAN|nr:hypothetical protein [Caulifigura coniformis]QDT52485.1 hypothetical protein Pan44_04970 [Caulifigura coniformis]
MSRVRVAAVVSAALAVVAGVFPSPFSVIAKDAPAAKPGAQSDGPRRVPQHFGKLDLTGDQKTRIYAIQDQYEHRIDALLKEIEDLKLQRDGEIESVLSAGQRSELKKILDQAKVERVQRSRETEAAKKAYDAIKKKAEKK